MAGWIATGASRGVRVEPAVPRPSPAMSRLERVGGAGRMMAWKHRTSACECQNPDPLGVRTPVVVLVHGTWAQHAPWASADGELTRRLSATGAAVVRFCWSGKNRHGHRLDGAAALRTRLLGIRARNPEAPLRVVAHSHGGNVALYALAGRVDEDDVGELNDVQVTTLATPFVHARPRTPPLFAPQFSDEGSIAITTIELTSLGAAVLLFLASVGVVEGVDLSVGWSLALIVVSLFLAIARHISAFMFSLGSGYARPDLSYDFEVLQFAEMLTSGMEPSRLTPVRALGDEAAAGLGFAQVTAWGWARVARWWAPLGRLVYSGLPVINAVVLAIWLVVEFVAPRFGTGVEAGWWPSLLAPDGVILDTAFALLWPLLVLGILLLGALHSTAVPFGIDGLFLTPAAIITAEATPVGLHHILQVIGPETDRDLAHAVYTLPDVLEFLSEQVREDAATVDPGDEPRAAR